MRVAMRTTTYLAFFLSAGLPCIANANPLCAEILRQGVYDYYHLKDRDILDSDIRRDLLNAQSEEGQSSESAGASGRYGIGSGSVSVSRAEANASARIINESNTEIIAHAKEYIKDTKTLNPDALQAFNQCIALSEHGVIASVDVDPTRTVAVFEVKHASSGSTSEIDHLQMVPEKAFTCKGTLAGMATGGQITTNALNMTCKRKTDKDEDGRDIAPASTVVIETKQGAFRYSFPALETPKKPPESAVTMRTLTEILERLLPKGTLIASSNTSCPSGWAPYEPSFGRFLRGIDPKGENDERARKPGSVQEDSLQQHNHSTERVTSKSHGPNNQHPHGYAHGGYGLGAKDTGDVKSGRTSGETRPKNVAVTFCVRQ